MSASEKEKKRILDISQQIYETGKSLNILTRLGWPVSVKDEFFKNKSDRIPKVDYAAFDATAITTALDNISSKLGEDEVDSWFKRHIRSIKTSAQMLANLGKDDFHHYSCELYGKPTDFLRDGKSTPLGLAQSYLGALLPLSKFDTGEPPEACYLAASVAERMIQATAMFGELAPEVTIVDNLSANVLAGGERIRIRRTACFTDNDVEQLVNHEVYVHVATLLNGRNSGNSRLLQMVHPGSTKTQEGLAVFAEFISGSIDLDRMKRLANRVFAIQLAIDGADFIEVYRYFLEQTDDPDQSFENARRVFRGGVNSGGAPFTKDIVYLEGLLRVHNFLRAAVAAGRPDCVSLLFVGKLDIEDIPVVSYLKSIGLCQAPKFMPPWASDLRFLLCYLSYSAFLNSIDMTAVSHHYKDLLNRVIQSNETPL